MLNTWDQTSSVAREKGLEMPETGITGQYVAKQKLRELREITNFKRCGQVCFNFLLSDITATEKY